MAKTGMRTKRRAGAKRGSAVSVKPEQSGAGNPGKQPDDRAAGGANATAAQDAGEHPDIASNTTEPGVAPAAGAPDGTFQSLTIGRRRQRRLALTLARGSISNVDTSAYVLGVFRGVAPSGAAKGLDKHLEGAIAEF